MSKTKKDQYRKLFKTKYKSKIDSLGDEKLKAILPKINLLKEKVQNSTTYSEEKKGSTIALLEALKEIIEEKLASNDIINSLLK
jgi:RNAse (barnase) inhibitor barstar